MCLLLFNERKVFNLNLFIFIKVKSFWHHIVTTLVPKNVKPSPTYMMRTFTGSHFLFRFT